MGGGIHAAIPRPSSVGVSRQARLPRPAALRGALPVRRRFRDCAPWPLRHIVTQQATWQRTEGHPAHPRPRAAGCPIAQGTDNNTNDMLETMRIALLTERIRRDDATPGRQPQPEDMLADAAEGAREPCGRKRSSAPRGGEEADLIVLDTRRDLVPAGRILSAWINNGQPSDIESVVVDGRFVMRDRKILTVDEGSLIAEPTKWGGGSGVRWRQRVPSGAAPAALVASRTAPRPG